MCCTWPSFRRRPDLGVFVVRLESDDPYDWPHPIYDGGATPALKGFEKVVLAQRGQRERARVLTRRAGLRGLQGQRIGGGSRHRD